MVIGRLAALIAIVLLGSCASRPEMAPDPLKTKLDAALRPDPDGFVVRVYDDGSGSVSRSGDVLKPHWSISCAIDKMSDKRQCNTSNGIGGLFLSYGEDSTPQHICVLGQDYPGRTAEIRIDKDAPITTNREGCLPAGRILKRLREGSTLLTRRTVWPYDWGVDKETSLDGFNKALEVIDRIKAGSI
jgi:hypothetical protein